MMCWSSILRQRWPTAHKQVESSGSQTAALNTRTRNDTRNLGFWGECSVRRSPVKPWNSQVNWTYLGTVEWMEIKPPKKEYEAVRRFYCCLVSIVLSVVWATKHSCPYRCVYNNGHCAGRMKWLSWMHALYDCTVVKSHVGTSKVAAK